MLILWRRSGQSLIVGEGVQIEVLEARSNRVKLGIVAPEAVSIVRGETRITRQENLAAALSAEHGMIESLLQRLPARCTEPEASTSKTSGVKTLTDITLRKPLESIGEKS